MSKWLRRTISRLDLRHQLSMLFLIGFGVVILLVSTSTAWIINNAITKDFMQQGLTYTRTFAEQSRLAILIRSEESAQEVITRMKAFHHLIQFAIYTDDKTILWHEGTAMPWENVILHQEAIPKLEYETPDYWQFSMAILVNAQPDTPYNILSDSNDPPQVLGYIRALMSKQELIAIKNGIWINSFVIASLVAFNLFFILQWMTVKLTSPVEVIATAMHKAEYGSRNIIVAVSGAPEFLSMGKAFNKMISMVKEREEDLRRAHTEAIDAARKKTEFAANISHEIRTPLNGIIGTLRLLCEKETNKESLEYLEMAFNSSNILLELINSILNFSKLEANKYIVNITTFCLPRLLEDMAAIIGQSDHAINLDICCITAPLVPLEVSTDRTLLQQLLSNLLGNAAKFTENGYISLETTLANRAGDDPGTLWIRFIISDTGIGISKHHQANIFDVYSQIDGSMSRKYGGTGLGLAICQKIVNLLRGFISVESETNQGTQFFVDLPLNISKTNLINYQESFATHNEKWRDKKTLLLAQDGTYKKVCQNTCILHGLKVTAWLDIESINYQELDLLIKEKDIEIIMINSSLPTQGIYRLLDKIKEHHEVKIIHLIRQTDSEQIKINPGIDLFLLKPLNQHKVHENLTILFKDVCSLDDIINEKPLHYSEQTINSNYTNFNHAKVLLVEDNQVNQVVAKAMLKKYNLDVDTAFNGIEAIECVKNHQNYKLILMDCQMPEMNGYDATKGIRALEEQWEKDCKQTLKRIPIIAVTANATSEDRDKCLNSGMDDFLMKPYSKEDMTQVLTKWLREKAS